jgi:pyruvate kinase
MLEAGMNCCRLNFSHGDHKSHGEMLQLVRKVLSATGRLCAFLLDTKGPEIRTGDLKAGVKTVTLKADTIFTLHTNETELGDEKHVAVLYRNITKVLSVGNTVLLDDGLIELEVIEVLEDQVRCKVLNTGELGSRKGVNLPGVKVDLPALTQKDIADIKFGVMQRVDFIAASFVRKASDVLAIREVLKHEGAEHIRIIAKIENQEGLDNFDSILEVADGIMVARGDLGVEIPLEEVTLAQKMMIRRCNTAGKPVITATQMLESMVSAPSPTRAEASDVANAVFDGTDCVMLSGETAKGDYPVEAVSVMRDLCRQAESDIDSHPLMQARPAFQRSSNARLAVGEAVCSAAVNTVNDVGAALVIVLTSTGRTAKLVAKYRPPCLVLAITDDEYVARQLLLTRSLFPMLVGSMIGTESLTFRAVAAARKLNMCRSGDMIVIASGIIEATSGATNSLRVIECSPHHHL